LFARDFGDFPVIKPVDTSLDLGQGGERAKRFTLPLRRDSALDAVSEALSSRRNHPLKWEHHMISSAQVSMYPLRQERVGPAIETVRAAFEARGLKPEIGPMSTRAVGKSDLIFAALAEAFATAAEMGEVVMTITMSNACPIAN
jgi:uncharacterized protein YqgV (UPF0045/DUF77 family)